MKIKELFKGMPVYIDPRCSSTEKTYGLIESMIKLEDYIEIDGCT